MRNRALKILPRHAVKVTVLLALHAVFANGESWRCGTKLVMPGDLAVQVREMCGDPISEELIGYTLRSIHRDGIEREFKIEQWIYGPEQGYYHVLRFEAGRLRDIDNVRQ